MSVILWILARLREPSTYAGIAGITAALGWNITDETEKAIVTTVMAVAGLAAMLLGDRAKS